MISLKGSVLNIEEYLNVITVSAIRNVEVKEVNRKMRCRSQRWKLQAIPIISLNKSGWEDTLLRINHYNSFSQPKNDFKISTVSNVKKYNFIEEDEEET